MPFGIPSEQIVDAEVVAEIPVSAPAQVQQLNLDLRDRNVIDMSVPSGNISPQLALYEQRARAVTLLVEIPLLSFVAMSGRTPGLLRLGAVILAAFKALELTRGAGFEVQETVEPWVQEWSQQ